MARVDASLLVTRWTAPSAPGPRTSNSPMWLMSKRPTAPRTVRCSSMIPVYCTGISQPPKGTILAPALTWTSRSGVRLSGVIGAVILLDAPGRSNDRVAAALHAGDPRPLQPRPAADAEHAARDDSRPRARDEPLARGAGRGGRRESGRDPAERGSRHAQREDVARHVEARGVVTVVVQAVAH